jgi:hypothetical protein
MSLRLRSSSRIWADANGNADSEIAAGKADAIDATLAELAALRQQAAEDRAVCLCGCPEAEHESRMDDGETCGHDDHECIRVPPAVLVIVQQLRQRLAEVERTPQALGAKIPDYWHEAKTLWPWLPSQPAIQLDDEWRNRTRAENALWLIEQAEQRAERAETALLGIRSLDIEGRLHFVSERNLCPLCQCRIGQHMPECSIGRLRAALAPVAEPAKCLRCDGSGEVQCGPPSDGPIPCPKCAPVAEQPEPATLSGMICIHGLAAEAGCEDCNAILALDDEPEPDHV